MDRSCKTRGSRLLTCPFDDSAEQPKREKQLAAICPRVAGFGQATSCTDAAAGKRQP